MMILLLLLLNIYLQSSDATCKCGQEQVSKRIINGKETMRNRYPWMVSVNTGCGGSLITDRHVLTAAHCLQNIQSPGSIKIVLGAHTEEDKNRGPFLPVESYKNHENYKPGGPKMADDIAIIKLRKPYNITDSRHPVCLPDFSKHDNLFLIGWGFQNANNQKVKADSLFEVDLPEVGNDTCHSYWGSMHDQEKEICAGDHRGGCQGDSGGPLSTRKEGYVYQVGIVSYGPSHCNVARFEKPNVYERITSHLDWIRKNTEGAQFCSAPRHPFAKTTAIPNNPQKPIAVDGPQLPPQPSGPQAIPLPMPGSTPVSNPPVNPAASPPIRPIGYPIPVAVPGAAAPIAIPVPGSGTLPVQPVKKGQCMCGMQQVRKRVRNGIEASKSYPWMASIIGDGFTCAGSLINSKYILTAAHCVSGKQADQLKVTLDAHTEMQRLMNPSVGIRSVILHEHYNGHILNDVALLQMSTELSDEENRPVCLSSSHKSNQSTAPFLIGWGASNEASDNGLLGSKVLREATLDVKSETDCRSVYGDLVSNKICAGSCRGATKGDGGAPLMDLIDGRVYQIGLTCFGKPTDCSQPDLYEDLQIHYSWIMRKTADATYCY